MRRESAEAQTAVAEGSQRIRPHGETRGAICGVQYTKFRKRMVGQAENRTASNRISARSISRVVFQVCQGPTFSDSELNSRSIPYAIPEDDMKTAEGDGLTCRLRGRYRAQVRANFIFRRYYSAILMPYRRRHRGRVTGVQEFKARNEIQASVAGCIY